MATMTLVVALQVVLRYFFSHPLSWGEEVTRYMFIYLIFLGAASGIHYGIHVSIDVLVRRLPGRYGRAVDKAAHGIVALFLVFLFWYGLQLGMRTMSQNSPALGIPIGLAYMAIPIGALLGLFFLFGKKERGSEEMLA
ncbi:TRAP transporter small permease [Ornithinimicrobium faecis]|uniref:TRAP transporter small permease n=1 Tax=Ornithinimicrobium faecis TaxID=2934158 RepID=A0ABY4YRI6_9MICO|nr:TRAP transporter small permease [Ornithinimicrobium sp. HY1793]USQ79204.1 TRAP transporter small permease [Ornithinimicrobium sp. HY1793]